MNALVETYRKYLASTGQADDSTDYDITQRLGEWAQQSNPKLFELYPDFGQQYGEIRDANAPSLSGELGRGLKSGTQGLISTGLGGLGLLTDSDYLKGKAAEYEKDAGENAPTIPTLEDIAPGRRGLGSLFSKDTARYGLSKLGSVAPSIGEGLLTAAAGAAIGSAVAPGPGTIVGAAEGLVARSLIKSAIRSLVKKGVAEELLAKGVITEASEAALEQAIKAGAKGLADKVSVEAMAIGAKRGLAATNLANSFLLNAGDVASEGADTPTTIGLGLISAIPDSILPGYVVGRMFPGVKASQALPLAKQFIGDRAMKALTAAGIVGTEAGTEYFQEAVNVVARNLKEGKDAMTFTDADLRRFREAGIAGGVGGGLAAPSIFLNPAENTTADIPPAPPAEPTPPPPVPPAPRPFAPLVNPPADVVPGFIPSPNPGVRNVPPTTAQLNAEPLGAPPVAKSAPSPMPSSGLIGRRVNYLGRIGVLRRLEDGTLAVENNDQVVEVENAPKGEDVDVASLGVVPYRPVSFEGPNVTVGDQTYTVPSDLLGTANFDKGGSLVSVTLLGTDGKPRTIRDPDIAFEIAEKLGERQLAQSRSKNITPPTAVEIAGDNPTSRWIDNWTKGFLPQTVDVSGLLDLGESVMPDGSHVASRDEYWQMARPLEQRTFQTARANLESQIQRVEQSSLNPETKSDLTNELYDLLDRLDRFEKERNARTPAAPAQAFPQGAVPAGTPQGASETLAVAPPPVSPNTFFAPPASSDPEVAKQDRAQYDALQAQMAALGFDKVGTPEFNAIWQQSEDIKNRHGGMPPPTAEQVTLAQLPADIVANVTGQPAPASAGVQPVVPTVPPPRSSAAAGAAPSMEQQGPSAETVAAPAEKVQTVGTRASIAEQRRVIKQLTKQADKIAQNNPKKAKPFYARIEKEQAKLAQLEATKVQGRNLSVGLTAQGEADILNFIEEAGGINASKAGIENVSSYFPGTSKLLLRREGGRTPDQIAQDLHDAGMMRDAFPESIWPLISAAVRSREKTKKSVEMENFVRRFEVAFLGNEHPKQYLRAGQAITIDDLNVGDRFEVNGEKFVVKGIDENGNVTIEDGISRTIPAGTPVFPDNGKVKRAKVKGEAGSDFDAEMAKPDAPATNPGDLIPTADMGFKLAAEQQAAPESLATPPPPTAEMFSSADVASTAPTALDRANAAAREATPPAPVPDAVAPKPEAPVTVGKFQFGPVIESAPTMDFRNTPEAANLTPEQWAQAVRANMALGVRASRESSKADSRIAIALQAPDGRVIVTGLTLPDRTLDVNGKNIIKEPTLQRMGVNIKDRRVISAGGNKPALLVDAIGAGFKPLAILHFSAEAGRIHETFPSQAEFDAAWGQTPKTEGRNVQPPALRAAIPRAQKTQGELEKAIEALGDQFYHTTGEAREAIRQEIRRLYAELDRVVQNNQDLTGDAHPPEYRQDSHSATAIQATRVGEFQRVLASLQQIGMRVDVFSRELLAQSTTAELQRRLAALQQEAQQNPDPVVQAEIGRRMAVLQERLQAVDQAAGVTYSPWHVALAADDVGNASSNNLVTLLHEAAEALTMRLPVEQRGAVRTAINSTIETIRARAAAAAEETGVPLAKESSPTDLLAETLAQEMAAAGIPDSPSLAQAILRWVKDLYYRAAMALQAGFGGEPDPATALNWYENQLRREVSGDYSYEFGNLLEKYLPSPLKEKVRRFDGLRGTPGGIPDFVDPVSGVMRQPSVETLNRDSLNWNLEYRQPGDPGAELAIPDPEARARIKGGVLNALADFYEKLRLEIAPDMAWNDFFGQIKRTAEEDPKLLAAALNERIVESGNAKIGGEGMTDPMNREAQVELWGRLRKLGLSLRRQYAKSQQAIADANRQFSEVAQEINKVEGDLRNAALHDDRLRARAKELVKSLAKDIATGRTTAMKEGSLSEAIRQEENLLESDPIPERYQSVLKQLSDGTTPIFDYIRAIADLDLPLSEMTTREVIKAIRGGADHDTTLAQLAANKPLAVALATLARKNAEQVDQIQLGWLRDTSKFREIHAQLEEIKTATAQELKELGKQIDERGKASGLAARLKVSYLAKRRRQQAASARIERAEAKQAIIEKAVGPVDLATADAAQAAGGAQYEWAPEEGAVWTAMKQDAEGNWRRQERTLRFNPDGSAVNGDQLRQDIAANMVWLAERRDQEGKPRYNQIAAQTYALQLLDARGQQQRTWSSGILNAVDRFVRTPIASARSLGGPAMQRVIQMLNKYQFILRSYAKSLEAPAAEWQHEFTRLRNASGLKDNGEFMEQVYRPVMYFLSVNPGLEEGPAVRQAMALAKKALPNAQPDFNERFTAFIRKTRETEGKLLAIAEQYGVFVDDKRLGDFFRRAIPRGILTGMRSMNGGVIDVITKDMQRAGWKLAYTEEVKDGIKVKTRPRPVTFAAVDPRNAATPEEADAIYATLANPDALRPLLSRLFTPSIIGQWLEPFIRKPGQEPFSHDGEAIPQALVGEAWQQAGGDVLGWIDRLGEMLDVGSPSDTEMSEDESDMEGDGGAGQDAVAMFRLSMFRQLDQLFAYESKLAADASQTPGLLDPHGAKPHALMDARVSDLLPPEHVDFATYEPESIHRLLARVAYHGAFGRNAKNIQAAFRENMNYLKGRASEYETLSRLHTSAAGRQAEAAARGWNYDELKTASKRYDEMKDFQSQLEAVLGVSANSGPLGDFHKAMSMMNFVVGQIVDNPKTAAYNIISPAMRPFAQRSLGPKAISNTVKAYANILQTGLGSLFQSFGLHLFKAGRYADTIGNAEGRAFSNLPTGVVLSDIGHSGDNQAGLNKWMVKPLKIARNLQRKGLQVGTGEATEFPRLAVVPGLGVINSISNIEIQASGAALAQEFEQLVHNGVKYMAQHPDAANNPSFQFKASDLYNFKLDHPLFDWWKQKTVEYNLGNLEDIVRAAAKRQAEDPAQRTLTDDQALTMSMMNQNEFSGNSSINTTPGWLMTNPFLRMVMPLMRWPLWMMSAVHEAAKPKAGENAVKPMLRAISTLALWNLPMGIAFSLLMDEYDKRLAGKKSNLPAVSGLSALPLVGLPLGLLNAKDPVSELEAMLVRSARAGNIYGLGADVAAQTLVGLDASTGQRSVSLDQRVLVMSQLTNIAQALLAYKSQGYANWGSVARPLLMAMGGNGVLHSVDVTNNLLGLDNAQSRLVQRASSSNWLRAAAQELDFEVRKGSSTTPPTPMSAHTREMYLAALANDRADFLEQYRLALNAAREKVADDPAVPGPDKEKEARNRVLASWQARGPLSVLASKPTEAQVQRMLAIMDPQGQESVREAMQRFKTFSEMIQPSPVERYFNRQMSSIQSQMSGESLRRQMTGGLLFSGR